MWWRCVFLRRPKGYMPYQDENGTGFDSMMHQKAIIVFCRESKRIGPNYRFYTEREKEVTYLRPIR